MGSNSSVLIATMCVRNRVALQFVTQQVQFERVYTNTHIHWLNHCFNNNFDEGGNTENNNDEEPLLIRLNRLLLSTEDNKKYSQFSNLRNLFEDNKGKSRSCSSAMLAKYRQCPREATH